MIDVFLFVALIALMAGGYLVGSGRMKLTGTAARRGLVIHSIDKPTPASGGAIWFYADRETAVYFTHFGNVQERSIDPANGDILHILYVSRHVNFDEAFRQMAQHATGITPNATQQIRQLKGGNYDQMQTL